MSAVIAGLLAAAGFLLMVATVSFVVWLLAPFVAQAWSDWRRRSEGWADRIARFNEAQR